MSEHERSLLVLGSACGASRWFSLVLLADSVRLLLRMAAHPLAVTRWPDQTVVEVCLVMPEAVGAVYVSGACRSSTAIPQLKGVRYLTCTWHCQAGSALSHAEMVATIVIT